MNVDNRDITIGELIDMIMTQTGMQPHTFEISEIHKKTIIYAKMLRQVEII